MRSAREEGEAMTAEERFQRLLDECDAKHATGPDAPCETCGVAAIRAAEDEALERAARALAAYDAPRQEVDGETRNRVIRSCVAVVRSLKSGGGK